MLSLDALLALNDVYSNLLSLIDVAKDALYADALWNAPHALALTTPNSASVANPFPNEDENDSIDDILLSTDDEYAVTLPIPVIVDALTEPITATEPLTLNEPVTDVTAADDVPNELSPFAIIP